MPEIAIQPPLSYSIPSFRRDHYNEDDRERYLQTLLSFGFRWVTLTPTFMVTPWPMVPRLELSYSATPSFETISQFVRRAIELGFHVKLEPHLDFRSVFESHGEDDWRLRMYFQPGPEENGGESLMRGGYSALVLERCLEVFAENASVRPDEAPHRIPCFALTLGSELDVSLFEFSGLWRETLNNLKRLRDISGLEGRLAFGHKLNHDTLSNPLSHVKRWLNNERQKRGLDPATNDQISALGDAVVSIYLSGLDYVSFSLYSRLVRMTESGSPEVVRILGNTPPTDAELDSIAEAFENITSERHGEILENSPLDVGEFGLGSRDTNQPFLDEPLTLLNEDRSGVSESARNKRRKYYLGFLRFLRTQNGRLRYDSRQACSQFTPVSFWTVNQYDFLGLFRVDVQLVDEDTGEEVELNTGIFADEQLISAVREYNESTYEEGDASSTESGEPTDLGSPEAIENATRDTAHEIIDVYLRIHEARQLTEEDCATLRKLRDRLVMFGASEDRLEVFDRLVKEVCGAQ